MNLATFFMQLSNKLEIYHSSNRHSISDESKILVMIWLEFDWRHTNCYSIVHKNCSHFSVLTLLRNRNSIQQECRVLRHKKFGIIYKLVRDVHLTWHWMNLVKKGTLCPTFEFGCVSFLSSMCYDRTYCSLMIF